MIPAQRAYQFAGGEQRGRLSRSAKEIKAKRAIGLKRQRYAVVGDAVSEVKHASSHVGAGGLDPALHRVVAPGQPVLLLGYGHSGRYRPGEIQRGSALHQVGVGAAQLAGQHNRGIGIVVGKPAEGVALHPAGEPQGLRHIGLVDLA